MTTNNTTPSAPASEYPPLPEPIDCLAQADGFNVVGEADVFTADQMRAYVDADRKARSAPRVAPVLGEVGEREAVGSSALADALRLRCGSGEPNQELLRRAADALDRLEYERAATHQNFLRIINSLRDIFCDEKVAWQGERGKLDKALNDVITERDEYHDVADRLASAIADYFLSPIGEHTSSNCPWMRALELIQNPPVEQVAGALTALRDRLERIHAACSDTRPKQAVGEMIAGMLAMPEWNAAQAVSSPSNADAIAAAQDAVRQAYIAHFGSDKGWTEEPGSWFIEGYRAALAAKKEGQS